LTELERLIAEQKADDTDTVEPQRFGAGGYIKTVPYATVYEGSEYGDSTYDPGAMIDREEADEARALKLAKVAYIVATLPAEYREAYRMVYAERLSIRQAAEVAKVAPGTIQYRLERVGKAVKDYLETTGE